MESILEIEAELIMAAEIEYGEEFLYPWAAVRLKEK